MIREKETYTSQVFKFYRIAVQCLWIQPLRWSGTEKQCDWNAEVFHIKVFFMCFCCCYCFNCSCRQWYLTFIHFVLSAAHSLHSISYIDSFKIAAIPLLPCRWLILGKM